MDEYESLSHTKWECKYHVVFIPKRRLKLLYGELRQHLGEVFRKLALQKKNREVSATQPHPVVAPQVSNLRHVPLRTRVKLLHSGQASPV
jgi:hypothetical protein